jgi:hypothetical protein
VLRRTNHTISQSIGGAGVSPEQAQAKACGYHKLPFDCNSVSQPNKQYSQLKITAQDLQLFSLIPVFIFPEARLL